MPAGESALMIAARSGKTESFASWSRGTGQLEARERWRGQTALMWAAAEGHRGTVRALVEPGADIKARIGRIHAAPLCVRAGQRPGNETLLTAGADINDLRASGQSSLRLIPVGRRQQCWHEWRLSRRPSAVSAGRQAPAPWCWRSRTRTTTRKVPGRAWRDPNAADGWTRLHQLLTPDVRIARGWPRLRQGSVDSPRARRARRRAWRGRERAKDERHPDDLVTAPKRSTASAPRRFCLRRRPPTCPSCVSWPRTAPI